MRSGNLTEDWLRLQYAAQRLKDRPLFIDDTSGITPLEMRNRIKQFTREASSTAPAMALWHGADARSDMEALIQQAQPA